MSCPTCNRNWIEKKNPEPYKVEWQYVCVPSGRTDDAQVTEDDHGTIHTWSRGADFGEYQTIEQAKQVGEKTVVNRKLDCPQQ